MPTRYFYPRPLRGGRRRSGRCSRGCCYFYPRPLRGGRRGGLAAFNLQAAISIHALCEEGDSFNKVHKTNLKYISIHALCEEGDQELKEQEPSTATFLSTPSARRATERRRHRCRHGHISIHALCEEGDPRGARHDGHPADFYPRPLRGGRPRCRTTSEQVPRFLSTPSARRATSRLRL